MKKSKHKHVYEMCMFKSGRDLYTLVNVCTICGFRRRPPFKDNLFKYSDGSWKWLCRKQDILERYPNVKEVEPDA